MATENYSLQYGFTPIGSTTGTPSPTQITIDKNSLQSSFANIALPGKNYLGYGQAVDQTLVNMTEHFASCSGTGFNLGNGPMNPIVGQIWFDASANVSGALTGGVMKYRTGIPGSTTANVWNEILVAGTPITSAMITGGNVTGLTNLSAATGNITNLQAPTGNIATLTTNSISPIGGNTMSISGPGVFNGSWTLAPGATLNATYADLAERHHADAEYSVGTVMTVGGANEVTACKVSELALGVVSDQYAYLMNSEAGPDETHPAIGYIGRVQVRVIGAITKHQRIAPAGNGQATAADKNSFGWALETNNEVGEKLVLCLIK